MYIVHVVYHPARLFCITDTPMAVDDFELEMNEHRDTVSDPDSRSSHDK